MATHIQVLSVTRPFWRRSLWPLLMVGLLVLVYLGAQMAPIETKTFPEAWNLGLRAYINNLQTWVIAHRSTHPIFLYFFAPLSSIIDLGMRWAENILLNIPWLVVVTLFAALGYLLAGLRLTLLCVATLVLCGMFGLWEQSMQTLALMAIAVACSLVIGIPLGIIAAYSARFDRVLRPLLDAMQTMPAFVYLIPLLLFFGVGRVPAVIATLIYAVPPVLRLTSLGIRQVSPPAVEAAKAFGSTQRQLLLKVQLPLALPSIMTGVNQTIMMALSMVVIAALIGAGGLGREVMVSLDKLEVGQGFEAGLAIVLLAIMLDRLSHALSALDLLTPAIHAPLHAPAWLPVAWEARYLHLSMRCRKIAHLPATVLCALTRSERARNIIQRCASLMSVMLLVLLVWLGARLAGLDNGFPANWRIPLRVPIDALVAWMKVNLYQIGDLPLGTKPFSDFLALYMLNPMRALLRDTLSWPVVLLGMAAIAYWAGGWRLALLSLAGLFLIGLLGMWELSMDTFSQVLITMLCASIVAIPLGVLASQSPAVANTLRPILDFLQTIPTFVYLMPVIMLFNIGRVPGLIAAALYAIPPGIKLTELGIRQVEQHVIEAAHAFGATRRQLIFHVQLPLALPSIMVGINQMIMMVLAMVIISGLVGSGALGLEVVTGLRRVQTGRGLEAGLAIVILAIVLDRITQAWAKQSE